MAELVLLLLIILPLIVIAQTIYLIISEEKHRKERQELYSRLMARDLPEYDHTLNKTKIGKGKNFFEEAMEKQRRAQQIYQNED